MFICCDLYDLSTEHDFHRKHQIDDTQHNAIIIAGHMHLAAASSPIYRHLAYLHFDLLAEIRVKSVRNLSYDTVKISLPN